MKRTGLALILLGIFFLSSIAQNFPNLEIDKKSADINNVIYIPGKVFTYSYFIYEDSLPLKLISIDKDNIELTPKLENDSAIIESFDMTILLIPRNKSKTNKWQTEVGYTIKGHNTIHCTGVVENRENVWMHPIRAEFFEVLETCPYPYIKNNVQKGEGWSDKLKIGDHWKVKSWCEWEGSLLLDYNYIYKCDKVLNTAFGEVRCKVIESTAKSRAGNSYLTSYFSDEYGFVKCDYKLWNGKRVEIQLVQIEQGDVFNSRESFAADWVKKYY